jgi:uncharacterized protein (DUF2147 family)
MIRMTYTNRFALLALAALTGALAVAPLRPAIAADPAGTWLTETGTSRIRIADCGGALCGTVVWMKEPIDPETHQPRLDKFNADTAKRGRPLMGVTIVLGMKPSGPEKWSETARPIRVTSACRVRARLSSRAARSVVSSARRRTGPG